MGFEPKYGDPDNTLLFKIASLLQSQTAGDVSSFNGRSGAVTLTSGDVTGALGFTPANAAALAAYVLKAGDTMTGLLTITQGTANTSVFAPGGGSLTGANAQTFFDYSGTWNTSGSPTAFKLNITNTASGASALLVDVQASGISQFSIAKESTTLFTRTQADTSGMVLALQKKGTTGNAAAAVANGDTISSIEARGFDGTNQGTAYTFRALALEAFTTSAHGTRIVIGIPAIGSTTATARFDLRATALALTNGCSMNVALGTITASQFVYEGSVTWNAAVTFTGIKLNVTDTSSNAASKLIDLQVASASVFAVSKSGVLLTNLTFDENVALVYDAALSADGKYCGVVRDGVAAAALAFGDVVYFVSGSSRWDLADADAASTGGDVQLGICVLAAAGAASVTKVMFVGMIRADSKFPSLTIGAPVYLSGTAGAVQVAQPSSTDQVIRRLGFADTADSMYFNPSNDYITHT